MSGRRSSLQRWWRGPLLPSCSSSLCPFLTVAVLNTPLPAPFPHSLAVWCSGRYLVWVGTTASRREQDSRLKTMNNQNLLYIYLLALTCKCTSYTLMCNNVRFRCKVHLSCILFHSCTERKPYLNGINGQTGTDTSLFLHTVTEIQGPKTSLTFSGTML